MKKGGDPPKHSLGIGDYDFAVDQIFLPVEPPLIWLPHLDPSAPVASAPQEFQEREHPRCRDTDI